MIYSRLSLSRSRMDRLKHFEISVLRHIRFTEPRKIPIELPNFTNEHKWEMKVFLFVCVCVFFFVFFSSSSSFSLICDGTLRYQCSKYIV